MDTTPQSNSGSPGAAAAAALTTDPETQSLLQRHAAKEKLTAQEYGKIGAFAKAKQFIFGNPRPGAGPAQPGSTPGNPAGVGTSAPAQTPGDGLAPVAIDSGLAQRTTAAILNRADAFAVGYIERELQATAAVAPIPQDIADRLRNAAGLPVADKKLLVEISPDVFQELGIDPRRCALFTAGGVLLFHGWNLYQAIQELREHRREAAPAPAAAAPAAAPAPQAAPTQAVLTPAVAGIPSPMAAPPGAVAPSNLPKRGAGPLASLQEPPNTNQPAQIAKAKTKGKK